VFGLCTHEHGCRVVQRILETAPVELQLTLVKEIEARVLECVEDQNGNHVIQKCLERMPTMKVQFIID